MAGDAMNMPKGITIVRSSPRPRCYVVDPIEQLPAGA